MGGGGRAAHKSRAFVLHIWFKGTGGPSHEAAVGNPEKIENLRYFALSLGGRQETYEF